MRKPICPTGALGTVISEDIEASSEGDIVPGLATRQVALWPSPNLSHLLRTSTPAGYLRDTPGPRVEEEGQSEPLVGPEPASKGSSPDGKVALLWRSPQASTSCKRAPSAYYVPLKGLEEPVPTRRSYTSHS